VSVPVLLEQNTFLNRIVFLTMASICSDMSKLKAQHSSAVKALEDQVQVARSAVRASAEFQQLQDREPIIGELQAQVDAQAVKLQEQNAVIAELLEEVERLVEVESAMQVGRSL
jgi:hypothetical protein